MSKMVIRRIGVFSMAKIQGLITAISGLIIGIFYGLFLMFLGAIVSGLSNQGSTGGGATMFMALVIIILFPLTFGIFGFIYGAISAAIYNAAANFIGGIEMELDHTDSGYGTPPQQQWNRNQYGAPRY